MPDNFPVFITGGSGYIGTPLIRSLSARGHSVRALVRPGSVHKLPTDCCEPIAGDALDPSSYAAQIQPAHTFVQLVGVSHPSPAKKAEFQGIDRVAGLGAIEAARQAGVQHFIYLSVAQPAPIMKTDIVVRAECEAALQKSGDERNDCPALVCSRSRTSLALRTITDVLALRASSLNSRRSTKARPRDSGANDSRFGFRCRKPQCWRAFHRRAANSYRLRCCLTSRETPAARRNYESACTWDIF